MQNSVATLTRRCVDLVCRRFLHSSNPLLKKNKFLFPRGGDVPPDYPTCAYIKLPDHLDPVNWQYLDSPKENLMVLRYFNWRMQKDARKRATSTYYGPLRHRLNCVKKNRILPEELRDTAAEEIARLPRDSCRTRIVNRCTVTSRPRGKKRRWRMSRIVFRKIADHGKMSGMERAFWGYGWWGHK